MLEVVPRPVCVPKGRLSVSTQQADWRLTFRQPVLKYLIGLLQGKTGLGCAPGEGYFVKNCFWWCCYRVMGTAEASPTGHQSQAIKECIHWAAAAKVGNQTCAQPPSREGWAKGRTWRCHLPTSLVSREDCSQLLDVGYVRSLTFR